MESEPNDTIGTADNIGNAASFGGACGATGGAPDSADLFAIAVSAGTISVSLVWDDPTDAQDIDLFLLDSQGSELDGDFNTPPGDSPAEVTATLTSGMTVHVAVDCAFVSSGFPTYVGTVNRP